MGKIITIDPITRIEGHLKVKVELDDTGRVTKSYMTGNLYRDFENILKGRKPWDAVHITQRICGVCPVSHAVTASNAAEKMAGFVPNDQALLIRSIIQAAFFVSDHILHFYHLNLPDYVRPPDIGPLRPAFDRDMRFTSEQTAKLVANYVEALKIRRQAQEVVAILAGRMPHVMSIVPGGVTQAPSQEQINAIRSYVPAIKDFVLNKYHHDAYLLSQVYSDYFRIGNGAGNLLCFSAFDLPRGESVFRQGLLTNKNRDTLSFQEIKEFVRYAYYSSPTGLHPTQGETTPSYGKTPGYTWLKAPRHRGKPYETGSLARMTINGYYRGGYSAMDRILARAEETKLLMERLPLWVDALVPGKSPYIDISIPLSASGIGLTEAPRGALGHWVTCSSGTISRYQIITPTCWNASPRDDGGVAGPMEQALVGTRVGDMSQPVELLRIIHSFDPCTSCSVH